MPTLSREALDRLPFVAFRVEDTERVSFANHAAGQLAGRTPATLVGSSLADAWAPLAHASIGEALARARSTQQRQEVRVEDTRHDVGVWIDPDEDGHWLVYVVVRAPHRESDALSALRASMVRERRSFEAILSGTPDFAYIWSLDYKFLYANASLLRLYGVTAEQCIGRGFRDVGYPEWHARMHEQEIDEVARTGQPVRGKIPFYGQGGGGIYDYIFVPVLGPDGRVEAVGGVTRDVTELERTTEALKEADRRKDVFLATLAHELRNPIAPLVTGLRLVQESPGTESATQALATMERQVTHMVHLVDDLLDLSRVSRGAIELRRARHDLHDVLERSLELSAPLVSQHAHELVLRLPDGELAVVGDDTRLTQIFSNLVNNAAKYTPPGGTITVEAHVAEGNVRVAVSDTGRGIAEEDLPRLFELFTRLEPAAQQSGLGIGLFLVRRLVDMHGGTITATSSGRGRGSTFTVALPLALGEPQRDAVVAAKPVTARSRRILVVDDNVDAAFLMSVLLKHKGHDVHATYGAKEALDLARTFKPEVIFLDIGMPELDGYEACRRIRQMDELKHAYVVALTGWGAESDREKTREAGFDAHLVKPSQPERIDALLADLPERPATHGS